ncbi:exo-alpha-sialidase [Roseivirga echinicomitans]
MKKIHSILIVALIVAVSCQTAKETTPTITNIESPAAKGSQEPNLFTDKKGNVYLSWVEKKEKKATLSFSKLENGKWSSPQIISEGDNWFLNWADFPSIAVNEDWMAAHWLQKRNKGTYDYDVRISLSSNDGKDWGESFIPHTDGVSAEHGFVSMMPLDENRMIATWLDGRYTKGDGQESADGHSMGGGPMTLRAAIFDKSGEILEEWELDNRVCDCCQTSVTMTDNGPVVVYRNRSEEEIRDMYIVRYVNGAWTAPQIIHADNWEIAGCPVNGPSIISSGQNTAVAWFTASGGLPTVKLALSNDAGATFSAPIIVSEEITSGRVGATMLPDQSVLISYMETKNETAQIMLAQYNQKGELLQKIEVAQSSSARSSGFPILTSNKEDVYISWTEIGETSMVRTAKVNL